MIVLIEGSSDLGRALIAQHMVRAKQNWRHMAIDDLRELTVHYHMGVGDNDTILLRLACHLAKELQPDDIHLMISAPAAPHLVEILEEESAGECRSIHLGTHDEIGDAPFDCVLDTKTSAAEACRVIGELLSV